MKKVLCFGVFMAFLSCADSTQSPSNPKKELNKEEEKAAMFESIEGETSCFFKGDYNCWIGYWSHKPYAQQSWTNDDGSVSVAMGWDSINQQGKSWIEKYYQNGKTVIHPEYKRENIQLHFVNDSLAFLNWDQYNAYADKKYYRLSKESRIMEKSGGKWRIVNVTALWDYSRKIPYEEVK